MKKESEAVTVYENGIYNPAIMPYFGMQPQRPAQRQEVVKVNGENGAMALQLPPNSSAIALDMSGTMIWLITTDGAGYKSVNPFDITPHQTAQPPDFASLESRISALERMMNNASTDSAITESGADYTAYTSSSTKTDDRHDKGRK